MRFIIFLFFCCGFFTVFSKSPGDEKPYTLNFRENKGQVHDQNQKPRPDVLFSGTDGNLVWHLKQTGISYQLTKIDSWAEITLPKQDFLTDETAGKIKMPGQTTIYRLDVQWMNCNDKSNVVKGKVKQDHENYYGEQGDIVGVRSYEDLTYKNIYDGVDLHYYSKEGHLKYDYIVKPNANYKAICLKFEGADHIMINEKGELIIKTPIGEIVEEAPLTYQEGKKVKSRWVLRDNNVVNFEIDNYNKHKELIIDPVIRIWGTYYGGTTNNDTGISLATDDSLNVYMCGYADNNAGTIIATSGAHQSTFGGGNIDAFLAKFNTHGVRLWATWYGGNGDDWGYGVATDTLGNVFITGYTNTGSAGVISTTGSHQVNNGGGNNGRDAFLVKFNRAGVRQWGTYYGGNGDDYGEGVSTDPAGNVYLVGKTETISGTAIATAGSHQSAYGGWTSDAFLAKFNTNGVRQWGTYYGGLDMESNASVYADRNNNIYMSGCTRSQNAAAMTTPGCHQSVFGGSTLKAYLVKFNTSGVRQWGTYYGGSGNDYSYSICADTSSNVYMIGYSTTTVGTAIATLGSHQSTYGGGFSDCYLVKFDVNGVRQWGTYYGGTGFEYSNAVTTDITGNVYLTGYTDSNTGTVIATTGSHQTSIAGLADACVAKFTSAGVRVWGTYYGGTGQDYIYSAVSEGIDKVYIAGFSSSTTGTFIANPGSHQSYFGGGSQDGFLAKLIDCSTTGPTVTINTPTNNLCNGGNIGAASVNASGGTSFNYNWVPSGGTASIASNLAAGVYTCIVLNQCTLKVASTVTITQPPAINITAANATVCAGNTITLTASASGGSGTLSYSWTTGSSSNTTAVTPTLNTTYSINVTDINSCVKTKSVSVTVNPSPTISAVTSNSLLCVGQSATLNATGAVNYTWNPGGVGSSIVVSPTTNITYTITGSDANGCVNSSQLTQSVSACAGVSMISGQTFGLSIYPNPFQNRIIISADRFPHSVRVINILGVIVCETETKGEITELDLSLQPDGVYFIRIDTSNVKVIKE
jgi:hypothetical protein